MTVGQSYRVGRIQKFEKRGVGLKFGCLPAINHIFGFLNIDFFVSRQLINAGFT